MKDDAVRYNHKDDHSLSGHITMTMESQCSKCCKAEVRTVLWGIFTQAVVCDYHYPDDPGILDCVMKGECPYFSPTSTERVVDR